MGSVKQNTIANLICKRSTRRQCRKHNARRAFIRLTTAICSYLWAKYRKLPHQCQITTYTIFVCGRRPKTQELLELLLILLVQYLLHKILNLIHKFKRQAADFSTATNPIRISFCCFKNSFICGTIFKCIKFHATQTSHECATVCNNIQKGAELISKKT